VLFLVDRSNLGRQAKLEFDKFTIPETQRKFPAEYNVQHLTHNTIDTTSRVCISTVQRIFSILKGEQDLDEETDEHSAYELGITEPVEFAYNAALPPDAFDVIIIDEPDHGLRRPRGSGQVHDPQPRIELHRRVRRSPRRRRHLHRARQRPDPA
jgi:type I site-specific restriction endonuclease